MRTLIVNSAQTKQPSATDPWVQSTLAAVDTCSSQGHEIITSVGLHTWELTLWRAVKQRAKVHLVCPIGPRDGRTIIMESIARNFAFEPGDVTWHWVIAQGRGRKRGWALRDQVAACLAEHIVEVSLRPSGRLASLLDQLGMPRVRTHAVPFVRTKHGPSWEARLPTCPPEAWHKDALVHLTRSSDGPWPDEPKWQYYAAIAQSPTYPRSGFDTLCRILRQKRILGSRFRARAGVPRVCLTACSPKEALALIRFRSRYARYSFEPYGIAIAKQAALTAGARPVSYENGSTNDLYRQGTGCGNFREEKEWRVVGDLSLEPILPRDVVVITATDSEAEALETWCPYEVRSLGCGRMAVGGRFTLGSASRRCRDGLSHDGGVALHRNHGDHGHDGHDGHDDGPKIDLVGTSKLVRPASNRS